MKKMKITYESRVELFCLKNKTMWNIDCDIRYFDVLAFFPSFIFDISTITRRKSIVLYKHYEQYNEFDISLSVCENESYTQAKSRTFLNLYHS